MPKRRDRVAQDGTQELPEALHRLPQHLSVQRCDMYSMHTYIYIYIYIVCICIYIHITVDFLQTLKGLKNNNPQVM